MKETEAAKRTWIAGLLEHRVALGIALLASILLIVFMLKPSGNQYDRAEKDMHVMVPATDNHTVAATQESSGQPGSETPKYRIPEKPAANQQASTSPAQPPVAGKPVAAAASTPAAAPGQPSRQAAAQHTKAPGQVYFVQVGSYRDLANAQKEASLLLQKGWNSSVAVNAAGLHTVRIGPVSTRDAAEKLRQQLIDKAKLKGFIVEE
jgi:DedD protein